MGIPAWNGHQEIRGVWGGSPGMVPQFYAHQASNRFFREDYNKTRPSIQNIKLEFENETERIWFQGANGQGAFFYNTYPSFLFPKLVCSIGGRIFTIEVQGRRGIVRKLIDGNAREFTHAWFAQGFNYLFIQDGINAPVIWDGTNAPTRSNIAQFQMPIGSSMAFIHGRMVVLSADGKNNIFVGDIAYGGNLTSPADIIGFTESQYWAEGGSFGAPIFIGDIQSIYAMPFLDTGTGQNELILMGTQGFASLDLSAPREQWIDNQVLRVSLVGTGLVGTDAFAGLNGDVFYRSMDGISSYRNARVEYDQTWRQTPVSREVNYWLKSDRTDLLEFIPMVSWQNMLFTGCSPLIQPASNPCFGYHHYCRGWVVFDAQNMSTAGREGTPVWHGQHTGIRPWAMIQGRIGATERCFAFSFDRDDRNRLYEITSTEGDDVFEDENRKIFSFYTTQEMGEVDQKTNPFEPKYLNGGTIELSNIQNHSQVWVDYRPDGSPCWVQVDTMRPGCDCPEWPNGCITTSWPVWARKNLTAVRKTECIPGSSLNAATFHHCQVRIRIEGSLEVERFAIRMDTIADAKIAECLGENCAPIDCCPAQYDYAYHIAPIGDNDEVPVLDCTPVQPTYTSSRTWRAYCPDNTSQSAIGYGQSTSTISQADADNLALEAAKLNAEQQLNCPVCSPYNIAGALVDGGSVDFSSYFASGMFAGSYGRYWRLYDVTHGVFIAYGIVNDSGTLEITANFSDYNYTFDGTTFIFTDAGGGTIQVNLSLGCNTGGETTWPDEPIY